MTAVYCSECGFQNPESANFCARCGAMLQRAEPASEATQSLTPEDVAELVEHHDFGLEGPALVVRAGGGRAGEIFLDDVTVSRNHAVLIDENGSFVVEDQGSLNGTFVNRKRIDRAPLQEGDELQVGKYRMTFIA
jgi:hypothetical protein